jgi:NitT/TauT family transport system substrate-binding protein
MMAREELLKGLPAEIEWKLFGTGPAIIESFAKDELDMAYVGLPPAIIGISRGVQIKCVAGGHIEGTVIASRADAKAHSDTDDLAVILSQFQTIGVPGKGSIHDLILMDALARHKVSTHVRSFPWADEVLEAFMKGEVDAVVGTPSLAQAVVEFGKGKIIWPPNMLWPYNPSHGILSRESLIKNQRGVVKQFLLCHKAASELLRGDRESVSRDIARLMGIVDEKFVLETMNISPCYCASLSKEYRDCTLSLTDRLKELGYVDEKPGENDIFDLSLINEIHPEPSHYK